MEKQTFNFNETFKNLTLSNDYSSEKNNITSILENKNLINVEELLFIAKEGVDTICNASPSIKFNKDMNNIYWSIYILSLMEEPRLFDSMIQLCSANPEVIDIFLGDIFIIEDLPIILTIVSNGKREMLLPIIENPESDPYIRSSCLKAYINISYYLGIKKEEQIVFFRNLIEENHSEIDLEWNTFLVSDINDYLPMECIEEIKDLFGSCIIDTSIININNILFSKKTHEDFIKTLEEAIDSFKKRYLSITEEEKYKGLARELSISERIKKMDNNFEQIAKQVIAFKSYESKKKIGRNENCPCNSNKKYKHCCLNKSNTTIKEETAIFLQKYSLINEIKDLPEQDQIDILQAIKSLDNLQEPENIYLLQSYIEKFPKIVYLKESLIQCHFENDKGYIATSILLHEIKNFPNHIPLLCQYALYFIRKGEYDKASNLFNNKQTLQEAFPDRNEFYIDELVFFSFVQALYCIETNKLDQAKIHYLLIKKINLHDSEYELERIERSLENKLMDDFFHAHYN